MFSKILLFIRSLFLKNLGLLFFLISLKMFSQTTNTITEIHTDWKGYWTSNAITGIGNRPDDANNLLAFKWKSITYSTGVNDNILDIKKLSYKPQKFRALKIQSLALNNNTYILQGSMIDGQANAAILDPKLAGTVASGAELAARLTDGSNGLSLGTGIANIASGSAEFKIGSNNLNLLGINDNIPDLIVTQVAEPGNINQADIFKFVDAAGKTVGNEITVAFTSVPAIGTYSLDLFKADGGTNGFSPAATRDIRMLGIETSSFGITEANASQVDRFVVSFSGSSDCAFIAFNTNSLKFAELSLIKTATMSSCGKEGDIINYTFDIKNSGDVPITDIYITDPLPNMSISGNHIASLDAKTTATITGTYKVTAADVTAGKIVNSAKVTGTDPSLNIVEDISGTAYDNDISTTTILLASPKIGTITNFSCNSLGKVVLTNLPANENWIITQKGTATTSKPGTGTTFTMDNLAVGTYNFSVKTASGCNSPLSEDVVIKDQSSTIYNAGVWSNGLPDATKNVTFASAFPISADLSACSCTISSGVTMTVPSGVTLNITNALTVLGSATLTFNNGASLVQDQNTTVNSNSGNIFFKRNTTPVRRKDYTYWSSPVDNFTLHSLSSTTYFDKYYRWLPTTGWESITNGADPMIQGVGYIVRAPESYSLTAAVIYNATFMGVPNNGDVNVTPTGGKWNLIGNPYPSALDAVKFIQGNTTPGSETIVGAVYFWTHNTPPDNTDPAHTNWYIYTTDDYAVLNLSGTVVATEALSDSSPTNNAPTGNIASGQGFFVKALTNNQIKFTNKMRVAGADNSQFFKTASTAERDRLWLNFKNTQGAFKQLLVAYVDGASDSWDNNYDATTYSASPYVDFYSLNETRKLTIQGRAVPFVNSDQVPLGYKSTIVGDFTISIDHAEGVFNQQPVYLEDKTTGTIHDLRTSDYTFTSPIGTFTERFVVRYTNKTLGTGNFENLENGVLVSVKNKIISIVSSKENISEVTIFDITGKLLYNKKKVGDSLLQIQNLQSANQVLLVKVVLENDAATTRKIIFQ